MDKESKTVYLSQEENRRLDILSRHSGYPASSVLAIALNHLYEADSSDWPVRIPQSIRESFQAALIQNGDTLKRWIEREDLQFSTVNMVLDRLDKGKKVGWGGLSKTSQIIDKIETYLGRDDLRNISQDPATCYDPHKGEAYYESQLDNI